MTSVGTLSRKYGSIEKWSFPAIAALLFTFTLILTSCTGLSGDTGYTENSNYDDNMIEPTPAEGGGGIQQELQNSRDVESLSRTVGNMWVSLSSDIAELRQDVNELKGRRGYTPPPPSSTRAPEAAPPPPAPAVSDYSVDAAYKQGRALYLRGDYDGAGRIFQAILMKSPNHKLAPNAAYWLGECFYSQKRYPGAIQQFERVLRDYPNSNKAPDARLKIAYSYHNLGDGKNAMFHMRELISRYPKSHSAMMVKRGQTVFQYP